MKRSDATILSEDPTCEVWCVCGAKLFISNDAIFRCPDCGRGWRTDFAVYRYDKEEIDQNYKEREPIGEVRYG